MFPTPHDAYFKAVFSQPENAIGEFKALLPPALLAALDWSTARVVPGTFVDPDLTSRHSDLLYEVSLGGRAAFLYVLFEHQSRVDPLMAVRLLIYISRIWDDWLRRHEGASNVPPVIPLVLYHGKTAWSAATELLDVIDLPEGTAEQVRRHLPSLQFLIDDLTRRTDGDLRARETGVLGRLGLLLLRHVRDLRYDPAGLDSLMRSVLDLLVQLPERDRVLSFRYILEVSERRAATVQAALKDVSEPKVLEDVMTAADELRLEGAQREARSMLLRALRLRFGQVSPEVERRVLAADHATLARWFDRAVVGPASSAAEVVA